MMKFVLKAVGYLLGYTAFVALFSIISLRIIGDKVPRDVLNGLIFGIIVVVGGAIGGKLANEFKNEKRKKEE